MRRLLRCALIFPLFPLVLSSQSPEDQSRAVVQAYMTANRIPGMGVAIMREGRLRFSGEFGQADLEGAAPVTDLTLFRTASTVKPMTAVIVLQLAHAGQIDLDAPIQQYCKSFPAKRWSVTARRLLVHTAGVRGSGFGDLFNRAHFASVQEALGQFLNDSLAAEPGTRTIYSNAGYTLLACAIEGVTGEAFTQVMATRVFGPAGMTDTRLDNPFEIIPGRARPYVFRTEQNTAQWKGLWQPHHLASTKLGEFTNADPVDPSWAPGAGGYLTTPRDLAKFVAALLGGRLVPGGGDSTYFQSHTLNNGERSPRANGWVLGDFRGRPTINVLGSDWNGSSAIWAMPRENLVITISTNKGFEQPTALIETLAGIWGSP